MSLNRSILESPLPPETQAEIAGKFWGPGNFQRAHLESYFQYYTDQCRMVFQSHRTGLPLKTHQHITEIASDIREGINRGDVKSRLATRHGIRDNKSADALYACIDLTVRLVFMLDVGQFPNTFTGRRKLLWHGGPIQEFIQELFPEKLPLSHEGIRLGKEFTLCNMVRIAGFNVQLTPYMSDHLRLRDADNTVAVFHHASFLNAQHSTTTFPPGLVDETLATLALLLPQGDRKSRKWYNEQGKEDDLDPNALQCGSPQRRIHEYNHWHDRLVILKEAFDESRPATISQWWNDRREGTQWYTLWIAVAFTVLFGLFQSIVGAMQLYKAYHP
ncbi:hypothetical protein BJX99DRAFT_270306 [Aspergillus californicus]